MFTVLRNAWKVQDLRNRMLFILVLLLVYRLGTNIMVPGLDYTQLTAPAEGTLMSFYQQIAGGAAGSIFALGIGPYITASIIMQLLTVAIPKLEELQKEGESGRKKINQATRVLAVGMALLQAGGTVYSLRSLFIAPSWVLYLTATVSMVTGTIFIMWLSELITERGIGNGSSFIIFANIIAGVPQNIANAYSDITSGGAGTFVKYSILVIIFILIIYFVVYVQGGERKIPVHYSRVGRKMVGGDTSYIPLKVNIAGVMSIIFAINILQFPQTINQFVNQEWLRKVSEFLDINSVTGSLLYVVLIFFFTFFYTSFSMNPTEMAENMKKNASFIPGVRPGKPTADFIHETVNHLSWIGAFYYSIIALIPVIMAAALNLNNLGFGGTTLLIVTGVALDVIKQLESQLVVRNYKGFLN